METEGLRLDAGGWRLEREPIQGYGRDDKMGAMEAAVSKSFIYFYKVLKKKCTFKIKSNSKKKVIHRVDPLLFTTHLRILRCCRCLYGGHSRFLQTPLIIK